MPARRPDQRATVGLLRPDGGAAGVVVELSFDVLGRPQFDTFPTGLPPTDLTCKDLQDSPWPDGPPQRWNEIPSRHVLQLVRLALERQDKQELPSVEGLRQTAYLRSTLRAAESWTVEQTVLLHHLTEAS